MECTDWAHLGSSMSMIIRVSVSVSVLNKYRCSNIRTGLLCGCVCLFKTTQRSVLLKEF